MPHYGELYGLMASANPVAQIVTPASGDNVQMTAGTRSGTLQILGITPLAMLSITHPSDASSVNGEVRSVFFDVAIAAITWPGSTALNLPSSAAKGDSCTTQRTGAGIWQRRF